LISAAYEIGASWFLLASGGEARRQVAEPVGPGERTGNASTELYAIKLGLCLFRTSGGEVAAET
jgi:hypothetical protein